MSWEMKSEAFKRTRRSAAEVHLRVEPKLIQAASFGALQLSLGKTAPSREAIISLTLASKSGNVGASSSSSDPSSFDQESWISIPDKGHKSWKIPDGKDIKAISHLVRVVWEFATFCFNDVSTTNSCIASKKNLLFRKNQRSILYIAKNFVRKVHDDTVEQLVKKKLTFWLYNF